MEITIYERQHVQTKEVKRGTFEQVADLDKRLWSEPEECSIVNFVGEQIAAIDDSEKHLCPVWNNGEYAVFNFKTFKIEENF